MSLDLSPWLNRVTHDHAVHFCQVLPPESVNACITSSPYYGVRSYPCEPLVWETGNECQCAGEHEWSDLPPLNKRGQDAGATARVGNTVSRVAPTSQPQGAYCQRECACSWTERRYYREGGGGVRSTEAFSQPGPENAARLKAARWKEDANCGRCGAWRGQLGSEPLHDCLAWARGEPPCAACFVCHLRTIAAGIWRVLRPDGVYLLNLGDSFASGGRGSSEHHEARMGKGTAQAQALGRKTPGPGLKDKDLQGIPWRVGLALQADGWTLRNDLIWAKGNPMPESVTDRHTRGHEYVLHFTKGARYYWDAEAIREPVSGGSHPRGNGVHPKSQAAGSGIKQNESFSAAVRHLVEYRNPRTVLTTNLEPLRDEHFAAYPTSLIRPLVKAACPPGGVILEPFCGSGTTPIVAVQEGRNYVACEWAESYVALAERRINRETGYLALLLEQPAPGTGAVSERSEVLADGPTAEGGAPASPRLLPLEVAS